MINRNFIKTYLNVIKESNYESMTTVDKLSELLSTVEEILSEVKQGAGDSPEEILTELIEIIKKEINELSDENNDNNFLREKCGISRKSKKKIIENE